MKKIILFAFVLAIVMNIPSFVFASEKTGEEALAEYKKIFDEGFLNGSKDLIETNQFGDEDYYEFDFSRNNIFFRYKYLKSNGERTYIPRSDNQIIFESEREWTDEEKEKRSKLYLDRLSDKERFFIVKVFFAPFETIKDLSISKDFYSNEELSLEQKKINFFMRLLKHDPPELFLPDEKLLSEEIEEKNKKINEYEQFISNTGEKKLPQIVIEEEKAYYELLKWHWAQWEKYGTFTNLLDGTVYKFLSFEQMDQMQKEKEEIQRQKYEKERAEKKAKEAGKEYELVFTGNDIVLKEKNSFWSIALWIILISLVAIGGFLYYRKRTTRPKNNDQF